MAYKDEVRTASDKVKGYAAHDYVQPGTIEDTYQDYAEALENYESRGDIENLAVRRERDQSSEFHRGFPGGVVPTDAERGQEGRPNPEVVPAVGSANVFATDAGAVPAYDPADPDAEPGDEEEETP